ncbi:MAG TPA: type II toxin-antitoxin system RelE/ParE family toxin [Xanthobacteraceae bacterium]|nr:type II toxin-antitoxin system RelE/ParE family toxin [Xanthobacteraceae bacterium]
MRVLEYNDTSGRSPYKDWFDGLNAQAAAKVAVAVTRMGLGNLSNVKPVGEGVLEFRIDFGPGYRIYFGRDGSEIIILLGGGAKKGQQQDIETAKARWGDYKERSTALKKKADTEKKKK